MAGSFGFLSPPQSRMTFCQLKTTQSRNSWNSQVVPGHAFNAVTVDGGFGLFTMDGSSSFDNVIVSTNDPAFAAEGLQVLESDDTRSTDSLAYSQLASLATEATDRSVASDPYLHPDDTNLDGETDVRDFDICSAHESTLAPQPEPILAPVDSTLEQYKHRPKSSSLIGVYVPA